MEKIKILMIDDNESLVQMVKEYIEDNKKIKVVLTCKDGEEGLNGTTQGITAEAGDTLNLLSENDYSPEDVVALEAKSPLG